VAKRRVCVCSILVVIVHKITTGNFKNRYYNGFENEREVLLTDTPEFIGLNL